MCPQPVTRMKRIDAIIQPFKFDDVKAIQTSSATGRIGNGKIFVSVEESAARIQTGETGSEAL